METKKLTLRQVDWLFHPIHLMTAEQIEQLRNDPEWEEVK